MEHWKSIGEWPAYEVSDLGNVRRKVGGGKPIRPHFNSNGYLRVGLSRNGNRKHVSVASLVATTFVGPRPEGLTINHKDGNKLNNRPQNLEYLTSRDNTLHAIHILGRHARTVTLQHSEVAGKLNREQVRVIRHLIRLGHPNREILPYFPMVTIGAIKGIRSKQTWRASEFLVG